MKNNINKKANIIFFLIIIMAAAIGAAWYFSSSDQYTRYQLFTHDSVSGLIENSPVEFHGVEIGLVKEIDLIDPQSIKIIIAVKKTAPITRATMATITGRGLASRGFTGYVFISLEDFNNDYREIAIAPGNRYPVIPTLPSKFGSLDTSFDQLNKNVQAFTNLIQSILDKHTINSLKEVITDLQLLTKNLANNNQKLTDIINNTHRASYQFDPLLQSGIHTFDTVQTQLMPETYNLINSFNNLSNSLQNLADKVNQDPSIVIRGVAAAKPGPGESVTKVRCASNAIHCNGIYKEDKK